MTLKYPPYVTILGHFCHEIVDQLQIGQLRYDPCNFIVVYLFFRVEILAQLDRKLFE